MGRLVTFGKATLTVRSRDHLPPHFHVTGPDVEAMVGIEPVAILRGALPGALWRQVQDWAAEHHHRLVSEWNRVNPHFPIRDADARER